MQHNNTNNEGQKNTARLAQLLLFSAGDELRTDLMPQTGLSSIDMRRYGGHSIYQSDWIYYKTFIDIAEKKPCGIIEIPCSEFIKLSGRLPTTFNRSAVHQLTLSLPNTTVVIKNNNTNTISISESLLDHLSVNEDMLYFSVSKRMVDFWLAGEWNDTITATRTNIGSSEFALWLYAFSLVMPGKITPSLDKLSVMSAIKTSHQRNFLQHARRSVAVINKNTSLNFELGINKKKEYVIAFHDKVL